ncbi:MAG: hypothetical protein BWY75_02636 [bacterium ADurb.Bin425]|nr:MAG: hypothetical protein BWY75_02636 [bacterium ADurb.Bin425]
MMQVDEHAVHKPCYLFPGNAATGILQIITGSAIRKKFIKTERRRQNQRLLSHCPRIEQVMIEIPKLLRCLRRYQVGDNEHIGINHVQFQLRQERSAKSGLSGCMLIKIVSLLVEHLTGDDKTLDTPRLKVDDSRLNQSFLVF